MTRRTTSLKAKRYSKPPGPRTLPPDAMPNAAPANVPGSLVDPGTPPGDVVIPRALLLHQRRRLEEHRGRAVGQPLNQPWDKMFEAAMYPATMGPDQVNDRMGYGERLLERRTDGRDILRTRSGSVPLDAEVPPDDERELTPVSNAGDASNGSAPSPAPATQR